eukprot:GEZU01033378.1.p1 GENE.GEZU01033378.1~~GEZU01033378.1.p1  ORF type:complete len:117 (+),score=23.75 GEZU01033378.1:155-505(+)
MRQKRKIDSITENDDTKVMHRITVKTNTISGEFITTVNENMTLYDFEQQILRELYGPADNSCQVDLSNYRVVFNFLPENFQPEEKNRTTLRACNIANMPVIEAKIKLTWRRKQQQS